MKYFVTAIGTDSGKTLVSMLLARALGAYYWKPIQAGLPADSDTVAQNVDANKILPEAYRLKTPASPHSAARIDGIKLRVEDIRIPSSSPLIIEGAGGCLVPLNQREFVIDIALTNQLPIILVANLYLGSINHTLLTIEYLKAKSARVVGIVFNGEANADSQQIIEQHSPWPTITHIPVLSDFSHQSLEPYVRKFREFFTTAR